MIEGIYLEWIDLQQTNRDMEFNEWVKFLLVITCAVYRIDPSELGFQFQDATRVFGQDGQKERLSHSREKGLVPLLIFYQNILKLYIISEIDDWFGFGLQGIVMEAEAAHVALDKQKLEAGVVSLEAMFEKYSGRKLDPEKDTILNSVYQQAQSAKMMGGDAMNGYVDAQDAAGGGDMFGEGGTSGDGEASPEVMAEIDEILDKSSNPILGKALEYIDRQLAVK